MRTWLIAGAALLALAAAPAQAQDHLDCAHAEAQQDMNQCADRDFHRADEALNRAYRAAMAKLDKDDAALLRSAQRAWLAFRDAECSYEAAPNQGGSIYPLIYDGCLTALTKDRTRQLAQGQQ